MFSTLSGLTAMFVSNNVFNCAVPPKTRLEKIRKSFQKSKNSMVAVFAFFSLKATSNDRGTKAKSFLFLKFLV